MLPYKKVLKAQEELDSVNVEYDVLKAGVVNEHHQAVTNSDKEASRLEVPNWLRGSLLDDSGYLPVLKEANSNSGEAYAGT